MNSNTTHLRERLKRLQSIIIWTHEDWQDSGCNGDDDAAEIIAQAHWRWLDSFERENETLRKALTWYQRKVRALEVALRSTSTSMQLCHPKALDELCRDAGERAKIALEEYKDG